MIITTLIENNTLSRKYKSKHGLCLHIETKEKSILFDLGPDYTFIENAFDSYYTSIMKYGKYYVGLSNNLKHNDRIILTNNNYSIDSDIHLFSDFKVNNLMPRSNESLLKKEGTKYIKDNFIHEQNLILKEEDKYILIAGCSHCGITNIIEKAEKLIGKNLDTVIGGFHLFNPVSKKSESYNFIKSIGENLSTRDTTFYTLHCTGIKPFEILSQTLKNQIRYLSTGQVIEI